MSVVTAIGLWPLLPKALALPSPEQLRHANEALQAGIAERDAALEALRREKEERLQAEEAPVAPKRESWKRSAS